MKVLRTHEASECVGRPCCIHTPSNHPMRDWPQVWRDDTGVMERTCPHGIGHPDPDHMAYVLSVNPESVDGIHGCDGCCAVAL